MADKKNLDVSEFESEPFNTGPYERNVILKIAVDKDVAFR
jgi:hypothetical protein